MAFKERAVRNEQLNPKEPKDDEIMCNHANIKENFRLTLNL